MKLTSRRESVGDFGATDLGSSGSDEGNGCKDEGSGEGSEMHRGR